MAAAKVKVGDTVVVRAGKDKGLRGTVLRVYRDADRVLVEGVNRVMRHQKAMPGAGTQNQAGGIINREAPIHISNVTKLDVDKKSAKAADKADKKAAKAAEKSEKKAAKAADKDEKKTADDAVEAEDES